MITKLTLQERLDCPHSYNSEDNKNLQCDYSFCEICDGTVWEHCFWDINKDMKAKILSRMEQEYEN